MKKISAKKRMDIVVVVELNIALLEMLTSVEASVLEPQGKRLLYSARLNINNEGAWGMHLAWIAAESFRHKLYTMCG